MPFLMPLVVAFWVLPGCIAHRRTSGHAAARRLPAAAERTTGDARGLAGLHAERPAPVHRRLLHGNGKAGAGDASAASPAAPRAVRRRSSSLQRAEVRMVDPRTPWYEQEKAELLQTLPRLNIERIKLHRIGQGIYGRVYKVDNTSALKKSLGPDNLEHVQKEAILMHYLGGQDIVNCTGYLEHERGRSGRTAFLKMPLASGTLAEAKFSAVSLNRSLRWFGQLLRGVALLSSELLVHGDISLANILIFRDGAQLADLGLACSLRQEASEFLKCRPPLYAMRYRAPEVWQAAAEDLEGAEEGDLTRRMQRALQSLVLKPLADSRSPADRRQRPERFRQAMLRSSKEPKADVWALAITFFEHLFGEPPRQLGEVAALRGEASEDPKLWRQAAESLDIAAALRQKARAGHPVLASEHGDWLRRIFERMLRRDPGQRWSARDAEVAFRERGFLPP